MKAVRRLVKRAVRNGTFLHRVLERVQHALWRRLPRFFDYRQNFSSIGIYLTSKCSLACANCDRAVTVAPGREPISVEQVRKFVDESLALGWTWRKIMLIGGEPTLHPDFDAVLASLVPYRQAHPECEVHVLTSGFGTRVQRDLARLPEWVTVRNSAKESSEQRFQTFNEAPVDDERFRDADFARGCYVIEYCGMELTSHGYYTCGAGGAVDRVFGLDLGVMSLADVTEEALREQRARLCGLCGHYKYNYDEDWATEQRNSPSWQAALARYAEERPELTRY